MIKLIICLIASYFLGSFPSGLIIGKLWGCPDIRKHGSGNIGATNVWRTIGLLPGIIVLLLDAVKGFVPVIVAKIFFTSLPLPAGLPEILVCISVLMGHNFSIFLDFKGGKGVATSLGVFLALDWRIALGGLFVFIIVVAVSKYISLGSIIGMIMAPVMVIILYKSSQGLYSYLIFTVLSMISVIVSHRSNIQRLLNGTERKIGQKAS